MKVTAVFLCVAVPAVLLAVACGSSEEQKPPAAPGGTTNQNNWPADDHSMCDYKNKPELEVEETAGPGAYKPNIRRVYVWSGSKDNRKKVLICREIDTNLDGIKDVVRFYYSEGPKAGEPKHEWADTDFDGKIDTWIDFAEGRISMEAVDTRHAGTPDVCKFYLNGQLSRVRRNTHCQYPVVDCRVSKPQTTADTWEIYSRGRLVRIGVDTDCNGHVDRWDRDNERLAQIDAEQKEEERQAELARQGDGGGGSTPTAAADSGAQSTAADGGR